MNKPEETEKISKAFKDGFGAFQEVVKDFTAQVEQTISPQNANTNPKEEKKQDAPKEEVIVEATNTNEEKNENEQKSEKTSENDNLFVEKPDTTKTQITVNKAVEENEGEKLKVEEYTADVVSKAKVVLDIFPQLKLEDVCEVVKNAPKKSVEELVQDFLASF